MNKGHRAQQRKCTNHFLEEGHRLTDEKGQTLAVLTNGVFHRWEAGSWRSKSERAMTDGLKMFKLARKIWLFGIRRAGEGA